MLDMGFKPQVDRIVKRLPRDRQTMFFSATLDGEVGELAGAYTQSPVRIEAGLPSEHASGDIDHQFVPVTPDTKVETLIELLEADRGLALVFVRTKRGADRLARKLEQRGVKALAMHGDLNQSQPPGTNVCWVQVRIPFNSPDDTIAGGPLLRRVRALRITMVSGIAAPDDRFTQVPVARLRVTGAGWLKRAARPLHGLGGEQEALGGFVIASSIGTQDRDSTRGLIYDPPPGVTDRSCGL